MRWLIARLIYVPTLLWNILLGRLLKLRAWWTEIDPHLIVGAMPFAVDVPAMKEAGVTAVVNTCQEYAGPISEYEKVGIKQLRVKTIDFTHPTLDNVERAVDFMNEQVAQGGKVYVHCKAGRARSATVALCWLIDAKGMTPEQGQRLLLEKRPHVNSRLPQREVVKAFWNKRRKGSGSDDDSHGHDPH